MLQILLVGDIPCIIPLLSFVYILDLTVFNCLPIYNGPPKGPTPIGPTLLGYIGPNLIGPTPIGPTSNGPTPIGPTSIGPTPIGPTSIGTTPIGPIVLLFLIYRILNYFGGIYYYGPIGFLKIWTGEGECWFNRILI